MKFPPDTIDVRARRVDAGVGRDQVETLAEETAVALVYNGQPHAVMMATPADLDDFAFGFSLTEGIVGSVDELRIVDRLATAHGISLQMHLPQVRFDALAGRGRSLTGRTGCGLCGTDALEAAIRPVRQVAPAGIAPAALAPWFELMLARQPLNQRTGAVHAAAVLDAAGGLHVREDVGRHNAIDKAVGAETVTSAPTPKVADFCTSSKLQRLVMMTKPVERSVPVSASTPISLSSALWRPTSSRTWTISPSRLAHAAPCTVRLKRFMI